MSREPLIVGIDPGNTTAVAALNFEGELVLLESRLEFSRNEIIETLIETGRPIIIGCDKQKMPSGVEKIASSLGAKKFSPEKDLSVERKEELGEGENSHEKDASAAARHAYRNYSKQIRKINRNSETGEKLETARQHILQS